MKVNLITRIASDGSDYHSLTVGTTYEVLGIEGNWYRILDDHGEPLLFDPLCFEMIDHSEPSNWVSVVHDYDRYAYPAEWGAPGFFEDWHDNVPAVRRAFSERLAEWHPETAHAHRSSRHE